jgi:hypothetical protein
METNKNDFSFCNKKFTLKKRHKRTAVGQHRIEINVRVALFFSGAKCMAHFTKTLDFTLGISYS